MSGIEKNLTEQSPVKLRFPARIKIGIVVSGYHRDITEALYRSAVETLDAHGVEQKNIIRKNVPGAYELPLGAKLLEMKSKPHAVICIGCVITGETRHNEYINHAVAGELLRLSVTYSKPFVFGVLTPENETQARERAGGKQGNKGREAAMAALRMLAEF